MRIGVRRLGGELPTARLRGVSRWLLHQRRQTRQPHRRRLLRLSEWIQRFCYPAVPVAVGIMLAVPSLWVGIQTDDWSVRSGVLGIALVEGVPANPWQPFGLNGDAANYGKLMDAGWMPWWTDPHCRAVHMRALPLLTHMFDYRVWDDHPALMHLHSLAWYAALVFAASILYRRILRQSPPLRSG